jgi:hypothetical protein
MQRDVREFTQQVQVISTNLHALTGRVETAELHAVENVDSNFTELHKDQLEKLAFELYDPCRLFPKLEHDLSLISNKLESGGGIDCNGNYLYHANETAQWFVDHKATICIIVDAVSILHEIGATVVHTSEATHTREAAKKIDLASDLEASIRASLSTTLPSILVGNEKETMGGAFECLIGYLKDYTVWHPRGTKASSGLKTRVRDGVKTVMGRLQNLRNAVTKDSELNELALSLTTDAQSFITELLEFVTTQYEDLVKTSTMSDSESWELVVDCVADIFEELHNVLSEVTDAGQYNEGIFLLWGMLRAWEIQERYRENIFKNDPALT